MGTVRVTFEYDELHDVYIAYPDCNLRTEGDCMAWFDAYADFYKTLNRRVDVIIVLDMFSLDPTISAVWVTYRARLHALYTRYTVRVASPGHSAVTVGLGQSMPRLVNYAPDVPTALSLIQEMRATHAKVE